MSIEAVLLSVDARNVATITLNRAELHNALDDQTLGLLLATLETVAEDPDIRAVVLTGNGISFSAGHDLQWQQRLSDMSPQDVERHARQTARVLQTLDTLPKPTLARVQGSAFGLGVALVACCDIAIGVSEALFSLSEVKFGQIPALSSPYLIRAIGERATRRYCISAERFNAGKAKRLGLLHQVVESEELCAATNQMVSQLLMNSPAAMLAAKQLVTDLAARGVNDAAVEESIRRSVAARLSDEGREGVRALIEMRKPGWLR